MMPPASGVSDHIIAPQDVDFGTALLAAVIQTSKEVAEHGDVPMVQQVAAVAKIVLAIDGERLAEWIEEASRFQATGHFVDPTKWMNTVGHAQAWERIGRAVVAFRKVAQAEWDLAVKNGESRGS